jgi:hypothetical protein
MFNLIGKSDSGKLNPLHSDPFKHECVERVYFWIAKNHKGEVKMHAEIKLTNGNTTAEHQIKDDDFNSLVLKTKAFIDSLPK